MSELRRQKRKAVRESKKNKTNTVISDDLGNVLDEFLTDSIYFKRLKELCEDLELEYPENAKSGYELPIFNKNPITNELEIHSVAIRLFTAFQIREALIDSIIGLDTEDETAIYITALIAAMDRSSEVSDFAVEAINIAHEKGQPLVEALLANEALSHLVAQHLTEA